MAALSVELNGNWPSYRSIKTVKAKEIASLADGDQLIVFIDGTTMRAVDNMFARYKPGPGDFVVAYEDGYVSISPKTAFVTGYVRT